MRIASLLSSATEIVFAIGRGDSLIGVSHECDWPAAARKLPCITRSLIDSSASSLAIDNEVKERLRAGLPLYEIDRELLESLAPDVIITQAQCDVCAIRYEEVEAAVRDCPRLGAARILALNPQSLADILQDIKRIGYVCEAAQGAKLFRVQLRDRIECVRASAARLDPAKQARVACVEWTDPLMLAGNWTPELIELAGGTSIVPRATGHSCYWSWDELASAAPEVLILSPCGFDLDRSLCEARALSQKHYWSRLPAVQAERVFVVDGNAYLNRSGPRMVDSLEILAHAIAPAEFPPPRHSGWRKI
jgi:iron complex transport system substrate-binding protein